MIGRDSMTIERREENTQARGEYLTNEFVKRRRSEVTKRKQKSIHKTKIDGKREETRAQRRRTSRHRYQ